MAEDHRMTAAELVAKVMAGEHGDFVREAVALIAHELMEAEISAEVGAELHEVSPEQITHRNGYHDRRLPAGEAGVRAARDRRAHRLAVENLAAGVIRDGGLARDAARSRFLSPSDSGQERSGERARQCGAAGKTR